MKRRLRFFVPFELAITVKTIHGITSSRAVVGLLCFLDVHLPQAEVSGRVASSNAG